MTGPGAVQCTPDPAARLRGATATLSGDYTRAQAERIAEGIRLR